MEAANADGVGSLQESSTFSTTAAELGVQSHCAEDEDVPQPEHEPADEASALNVLEVKEGEKDEETDEEKNKKKDEKDEDEELTASLVAGAFVASDAEQPEGEPPSYVESQADGEDPFEALGHVPPESESDLGEASAEIAGFAPVLGAFDVEAAWRADCAVHGAPGQHSDSDMQTDDSPAVQPLEEAVKKISSKEQMAAKMEERRKLEGLLPQEPQEATWHVNACDMCL